MKATLVPDKLTPYTPQEAGLALMTAQQVALAFRSAYETVCGRTPFNVAVDGKKDRCPESVGFEPTSLPHCYAASEVRGFCFASPFSHSGTLRTGGK